MPVPQNPYTSLPQDLTSPGKRRPEGKNLNHRHIHSLKGSDIQIKSAIFLREGIIVSDGKLITK
jgi:hypothetical protein